MNEKYNFTPPVDNILFKCEYCLQIVFHFNSKLKNDKIIDISIDYYDPQYNNKNNEKLLLDNNLNNNDFIINDIDENENNEKEFNEIFGKDNYKKNNNINDKKEGNKDDFNEFNDFVEITKEDFINTIDGKV